MTTSEDTLFVNRVILHKCAYAVTPFCTYLYRKRQDGSSLSQVITYSKHMQNLDVCERVLEASRRAKGRVLPFAQAVALYIIGWQLLGKASDALSAEDAANWSAAVRKIVAGADVDVIANARWLTREKKIVLYRLKYGADVFKELIWVDRDRGLLDGMQLISMNAKAPCYLYEITPQNSTLHIEGTTDIDILGMPFELFVRDEKSGERFNAHLSPFYDNRRTLAKVGTGYAFTLDLPLEPERSFSFRARFAGVSGGHPPPHYGNFAIFSQSMARLPFQRHGEAYRQAARYRATWRMAVVSELRRWLEILRSKKGTPRLRFEYVWLRLCYRVHRLLFKKPIWIFGDKEWKAGDNAENVYRYAIKQSGYRDAKMYFALEKSSADYASVAKYGHVIDPTTFRYKLLFLLSSVVVSSRAEESMVNPYGPELVFVKDLMDYDFVYLTHGTLFGDLAFMLGKPAKKIKLFSVSTQMERNALLSEAYGYREDEVSLMGMARYD
ncbi:MAG: CDP-glycerol glycerophosphotransferase family protein, partial [Coriobacteriaceae bacterium]